MAEQIVVSGGGSFWAGPEGLALDLHVLALTGKERPSVCYLPTASGDHPGFVEPFHRTLGPHAETSHLNLFLPPWRDPAAALLGQDVVYVPGGSTPNLLAVWRTHGIDDLLRRAVAEGTILYGASAGALCWFAGGVTDSIGFDDRLHPLSDGLGLLPGTHCPHFDDPDRRATYARLVADGTLAPGIAVDDDALVHFVDGAVHDVRTARDGHTAHRVTPAGVTALTATPVGGRRPRS